MQPSGLHHVSVCVHDVAESVRFYVEVLGLRLAPRPDLLGDGAWLDVPGGGQVHLLPSDEPRSARDHFALRVDDLEAAVAAVERADWRIDRTPHLEGVGHQAFLHDPSGNLIELNQPER